MSTTTSSRLRLCLLFILFIGGATSCVLAQELSNSIYANTSEGDCCFQFGYTYNLPQGITSIETKLIDTDITFSSIDYPLGSGWQQTVLQQQKRLRWTWEGGELPPGDQPLFDFCLTGWNSADHISLAVVWRSGNNVLQRDTLQLACGACWQAADYSIECLADSTYSYLFTFENNSPFTVNQLQVREPDGQDLIFEETLSLSASLAPGGSQSGLELHFRTDAAFLDEICFSLSPKRYLETGIAVECCTATYCFPIPDCDHCCTAYEDFIIDAEQEFSLAIDCENTQIRLQANALNDCDQVAFTLTGLGAGTVDGNEAITFGGLAEDTEYEICMTATRRDRNGENCYETASFTTCESFYFDCDQCTNPGQINWEDSCPNFVNLVCGCDGMTYLNACAALSWSGIQEWTNGPCSDLPLDSIPLIAELNDDLHVQLSWTNPGMTDYRYFLVQRRVSNGPWLTLAEVSNATFAYLDIAPLLPNVVYRIVGVTWPGKVVISNLGVIGLVATQAASNRNEGKIWPNPAGDYLNISLALPQSIPLQLWTPQGKLLHRFQTDHNGFYQLSTANLPAGCYLLTSNTGSHPWRKRVVIIHP
jgi:hypothetical protein